MLFYTFSNIRTVLFWVWNVPHGLVCLNTWSSAGAVWGHCRNFGACTLISRYRAEPCLEGYNLAQLLPWALWWLPCTQQLVQTSAFPETTPLCLPCWDVLWYSLKSWAKINLSLRYVVTYFVIAMRCKNHVVPRLSEQAFRKTGINFSGALEKPRRLYTELKRPFWWELGSSRCQWKGTVLSVLLGFQRETRV